MTVKFSRIKNNPDKKAAALRYQMNRDYAPRVIARGRGTVADKILQIATANGIPILEDKELVEVLSAVELEDPIPAEAFEVVAQIYAFLTQMDEEYGHQAL
ncbi:MAG: EscU/YscU/HrcU family type III secretion system export apparatus switch protein [Calditrichia bacterium]